MLRYILGIYLIVSFAVNTLAKELKPGFFSSKFNDVPNLMFWDFAGQLEYVPGICYHNEDVSHCSQCGRYSAAHEYFMSNRQAVYVIIFNVMEERDCRLQQVVRIHPVIVLPLTPQAGQVLAQHCISSFFEVQPFAADRNQNRPYIGQPRPSHQAMQVLQPPRHYIATSCFKGTS